VPTSKVYEVQAQQWLELANHTNELYARDALLERAEELRQAAQQKEQKELPGE
jgi:hypothetical protein